MTTAMFVIEDEWHAERVGEFDSRDAAMAELQRLAGIPWDKAPNVAPCTSWKTCGRHYEVIEFDVQCTPWRVLTRAAVLEIDMDGVRWLQAH